MIGYKLFRQLKDGNITSLFIDKNTRLPTNKWLKCKKDKETKGYTYRPFWHVMDNPNAPHLTNKGRVWKKVEMKGIKKMQRPKSQGGLWYLADKIKILE